MDMGRKGEIDRYGTKDQAMRKEVRDMYITDLLVGLVIPHGRHIDSVFKKKMFS